MDRDYLGNQTGARAGVGNPGLEVSVQECRSGPVDAQLLLPGGGVVSIFHAGLFHLHGESLLEYPGWPPVSANYDRAAVDGGHYRRFVLLMGDTLRGGDEPGTHLHAHGAQGCRGHIATGVDDSSGGDNRNRDGPYNLGHQDHGGNLIDAPETAAFESFGDDHVDPLGLSPAGMAHRRHLVNDRHVVIFQGAGVQGGAATVGDGNGDPLLCRSLNQLLDLGVGQVKGDAEGFLSQPLDLADHRVQVCDRVAAWLDPRRGMQDAQSAGVGYSRNQLWIRHPGHSRL